MNRLIKVSVLATALMGALLAVNYQPVVTTTPDRLAANCCSDPPGCPDPFNPLCPPNPGGLQAR